MLFRSALLGLPAEEIEAFAKVILKQIQSLQSSPPEGEAASSSAASKGKAPVEPPEEETGQLTGDDINEVTTFVDTFIYNLFVEDGFTDPPPRGAQYTPQFFNLERDPTFQRIVAKFPKFSPSKIESLVEYRVLCCFGDRKSTRLNSSHSQQSRMPSSA